MSNKKDEFQKVIAKLSGEDRHAIQEYLDEIREEARTAGISTGESRGYWTGRESTLNADEKYDRDNPLR